MRDNLMKKILAGILAAVLAVQPMPAYAQTGENPSAFSRLFRSSNTEAAGDFTKLEIRAGSLNGAKVVDLLNPSGDWKLSAGKDYYLYGEVKRTTGNDYLQIRFGGSDQTYNGVTFFNPPGGTYSVENINHDYLDRLAQFTQFDDPGYGSAGTAKLALQDGIMTYHIKDNIAANSTVNFAMGMVVNDTAFSGAAVLNNAVSVAVGTLTGSTFTAASSKTSDLNMAPKGALRGYYNGTAQTATLDGTGGTLQFYITEQDKTVPVALLYETLEFDVIYPKNAVLGENIGFTTAFVKSNANYGTMELGTPQADGENQKLHVTVKNGYRGRNASLSIYYRLDFNSPNYKDGQTAKTTVSNVRFTQQDGTVVPVTEVSAQATYTILDPSKDNTTMSAVNRTGVYNHTAGGADKYLINLGSALITNKSVSQPTPREKTYEASFNTTGTAANISAITVPLGTSASPVVTVMGKNQAGGSVTKTIDNPAAYGSTSGNIAASNYLLLKASDFGMVTFTGVKAEIGAVRAGYKSTSWTSDFTISANQAGAYGYFTTAETGIQVKNTFRLYNTNPAYRDLPGGDLSVISTATSQTTPRTGFNSGAVTIKNQNNAVTDSVAAGEPVKIAGSVYPYSVPLATKKGTQTANTAFLADPVFYLTLPQGLTYETLSFGFSASDASKGTISYEVENISYRNQTGDGASLYKITFPKNITLGYYDGEGNTRVLYYNITLRTSKSMQTKRYELNSLIGISGENPVEAMPYSGNPATLNTIVADTYGINGGKDYAGIAKGTTVNQPGFGLQQLAEINVYNAVSVTRIDGKNVAGAWHAYDPSDPNSIAGLGKNSSGKFRLNIENTSDSAASGLQVMVPIPKSGTDLGDVFMEQPSQFDMQMTWDSAALPEGFTAQYVKADAIDVQNQEFSYTASDKEAANAILLSCESVPAKANYVLYLDFTVQNGAAGNKNIWRNAFQYTTSDKVVQYKTGSYVASAVAGGTISGTVFNDKNRNGTQDAEEPGVPGVSVVVKDSNKKILSAVTDSRGQYEFLAVREENVTLTFTVSADKNLRFNVPEGNVTPLADGLSAETVFTAQAANQVNAAVSGYTTLSYHTNGGTGSVPENQEYVGGSLAAVSVKPDNLLRTGYEFKEWNTMADGTGTGYQPGQTFAINEDTTLYAVWELGTYTVSFNYRGATGGNTATKKELVHGTAYGTGGALPKPEKPGYTFKGWCTTSTGATANISDNSKFTLGADTVLYAIWAAKTGYTVHYETDGGTEIADKAAAWDSIVLPAAEPQKAGYEFAGWVYEGAPVGELTAYGELANADSTAITLTALWKAKSGYTVSYDLDGGSSAGDAGSDTGIYADRTVSWAEKGLLPEVNPTKEGHAFTGWYCGETKVSDLDSYGTLAGTEDVTTITLKAGWAVLSNNTVRYETNGGTVYSDKTNVLDTDAGLIPDTDPVRAGYEFKGWMYADKLMTVTAETVYSTLTTANTITLKADWTAKTYRISYDPSYGTGDFPAVEKGWTETGLLPAADPVKSGSTFAGWYYGSVKVTADTTASQLIPADNTAELTLKAAWSESSYTIVYDSGGGTYYSPKSGVAYSSTAILPDAAPSRTGYQFGGWLCSGVPVADGTACGSLAAEGSYVVNLTAAWTPKTGYAVYYNSSGGTETEPKTGVGWEDSGLLPEAPPTKAGYTFNGWVCGRNAVSNATAYGTLAAKDTAGSSITLVAQWSSGKYTVHYETDGGTALPSKSVSWGSSNLLPSQQVRKEGFVHTGWTYNSNPVTAATLYSDLAENSDTAAITLTAVYEPSDDTHGGMGTDVQGKVVEINDGAVYKIDLSWGAMKFEFSTQKKWNPETHAYDKGTQGYWQPGAMAGINNRVTAANHSNGDVELAFTVVKEDIEAFENVSMVMNRTNTEDGVAASGLILGKVPQENAPAPEVSAYLWLIGEPENISILNQDTYEKVGVITVTVSAAGGTLTPRN